MALLFLRNDYDNQSVIIVFADVIYLTMIMFAMGWNMWMAKQNKNNKLWMKIVGIFQKIL